MRDARADQERSRGEQEVRPIWVDPLPDDEMDDHGGFDELADGGSGDVPTVLRDRPPTDENTDEEM